MGFVDSCAYASLAIGFALAALIRATLHAQRFEFTPAALIARTPFREQRLPYRQIAVMRFSRFPADLLLETPHARIRIPRNVAALAEIRRAVSVAVWLHRGGDVPPGFEDSGSAFL